MPDDWVRYDWLKDNHDKPRRLSVLHSIDQSVNYESSPVSRSVSLWPVGPRAVRRSIHRSIKPFCCGSRHCQKYRTRTRSCVTHHVFRFGRAVLIFLRRIQWSTHFESGYFWIGWRYQISITLRTICRQYEGILASLCEILPMSIRCGFTDWNHTVFSSSVLNYECYRLLDKTGPLVDQQSIVHTLA